MIARRTTPPSSAGAGGRDSAVPAPTLSEVIAAELRRLDPQESGADFKAIWLAEAVEEWLAAEPAGTGAGEGVGPTGSGVRRPIARAASGCDVPPPGPSLGGLPTGSHCESCEVQPAAVRCGRVLLCADCATDPSKRAIEIIGGKR